MAALSDISGVPIWPGGPWNNVDQNKPTGDGAYALSSIIITSVPTIGSSVPELSTWAMMLIGFAGLSPAGYRRAKAVGRLARVSAATAWLKLRALRTEAPSSLLLDAPILAHEAETVQRTGFRP